MKVTILEGIKMYDEDIKSIDNWFDENGDSCTYRNDDEYVVSQYDVDDFVDFVREHFPDMVGIPVMLDGGGIWFKKSDLLNAKFL